MNDDNSDDASEKGLSLAQRVLGGEKGRHENKQKAHEEMGIFWPGKVTLNTEILKKKKKGIPLFPLYGNNAKHLFSISDKNTAK